MFSRAERIVACGLVSAAALVILAGCGPAVKWDVVRSKSGAEFQQWRAAALQKMTPEDRAELDAMVDEIRWSDATLTKEDVYEKIDGKPLAEVLRMGNQARVRRLDALWNELKNAIDSNALLMTRSGDLAAANALKARQREQHERLEKIGAQLVEAEKRIAVLTGQPYTGKPREITPLVLPRAESLREIYDLIARRQAAAAARYGEGALSFDSTGRRLPEAERREFDRRRERAQAEGRVLLGVQWRDKWWIYDAPPELPPFPPAIWDSLNETDRLEVNLRWEMLQAELWARAEAGNQRYESPSDATAPVRTR